MSTAPKPSIPRLQYGIAMSAATLVGLAIAWFMAQSRGGDQAAAFTALVGLAIGSIATFIPVILRISLEHWGVAVLFSGTARALIGLAYVYFFATGNVADGSRPALVGAAAGAGVILAVEVAAAVFILSRIERARVLNHSPPADSRTSNAPIR